MTRTKALFMAFLLAVCVGYIIRFELPRETGPAEPVQERVFSGLTPEAVQRISVVSPQGAFTVERRGFVAAEGQGTAKDAPVDAPWTLRNPDYALADQALTAKLLKSALATTIQNALAAGEQDPDTAIYGLNPPEGVFTLEGRFGKRVISFGKKIPVSGRRYAQPEGDPRIYVVADEAATELLIAPEAVREGQLFRFDPNDVEHVILQRPDAELTVLNRKDALSWTIEEGNLQFAADAELAIRTLRAFSKAKVKHFIDDPAAGAAMYGLKTPRLIVRIQLREGAPTPSAVQLRQLVPEGERVTKEENNEFAVLIGEGALNSAAGSSGDSPSAGGQFYARISGVPTVFGFDRPFYTDLLQPVEHFRPRHPFANLEPSAVQRLKVTAANGAVTEYSHDAGMWRVARAADGTRQLSDRIDEWLKGLPAVSVIDYHNISEVSKPETGLVNPQWTIELGMSGDVPARRILLGNQIAPVARAASGSGSVPPAGDAPRWLAVTMPDGVFLAAVAGAADAQQLSAVPLAAGAAPTAAVEKKP